MPTRSLKRVWVAHCLAPGRGSLKMTLMGRGQQLGGWNGRRRRCFAFWGVWAWCLLVSPRPALGDIYVTTDKDGTRRFSNVKRRGSKIYVKSPLTKRRARRAGVKPVAPSDRSIRRFTRYDRAIRKAAILYQIPQELIRAVIKVESDYDPRAVSHAGAQGLMQLMPPTAMRLQVRDAFDPSMNILGGVRYLRILANRFNGNLELTIAGYNAGGGAVSRYGGVPPFDETQAYVLKVLYYYYRYRTVRDPTIASRM